jgi:hypothetical protein
MRLASTRIAQAIEAMRVKAMAPDDHALTAKTEALGKGRVRGLRVGAGEHDTGTQGNIQACGALAQKAENGFMLDLA